MKHATIPPKHAVRSSALAWSLPENPFFTLELRRFIHRPVGIWLGLLITCLALTLVLYPLHRFLGPDASARASLYRLAELLPALHLFLCLKMGPGWVNQSLRWNVEGGVPDDVLLPYRPYQWLWRRLSLGVYAIFLLWLIGLPFYVSAAILQIETLTWAASLAGQVLLIALAWCLPRLLYTPAYPYRYTQLWQYRLPTWLLQYHGWLAFLAIICWIFRSGRTLSLGGVDLPVWGFLLLASAVLVPAVLAVSAVVMRGDDRSIHQSRTAFFLSFLLLHGLTVALAHEVFRHRLPQWGWVGLAAAPPLWVWWWLTRQRLVAIRRSARIGWLESAASKLAHSHSNPVFRIDTLRLWRTSQLWRAWLIQFGLLAAVKFLPAFLPLGFILGVVDRYFGGQLLEVWAKASQTEPLEFLFLTPQSSENILHGKLSATSVHWLVLRLPLLIGGMTLLAWHNLSLLAFLAGYVLPVALSVIICSSTQIPHTPPEKDPLFRRAFGLGALHLLLTGGALLGFVWMPSLQTWPLLPIVCVPHWVVQLVIARLWFRLRVQQLDELRAGIRTLPAA